MSAQNPNAEETIDLNFGVNHQGTYQVQTHSSPVVSLAPKKGTISQFLAPLTQDTFKQVVQEVEHKLKIVNETLSMLDYKGFETILPEMLHSITLKTGELLGADRTTIFLLDEEKQQL
ncbi:MAG: adenylate/guanylate cyclase domain-containing protein, partial [Sphaerospermopsis kisseleviana]